MEQTTSKGQWQLWVGLAVGLACLAIVFIFFAKPGDIIDNLRHVHLGYLLLGALGVILFLVIRAVRWRFMLSGDGATVDGATVHGAGGPAAPPYAQVFHIQNIGYMLTQLLPLRLGDVARAILIGNVPPVTIARGLSTMVVERLLDMLFIVVLLPFTLSGIPSLPGWMRSFALFSGFAALAGIVVLIVAANQRARAVRLAGWVLGRLPFLDRAAWVRRADELLLGLKSLTSLRDGAVLLVLSVIVWLPVLAAYFFTLRAVGLTPTLALTGFVVCAAAFSVAVPSTPGQAGPYHVAVIAALQLAGQPATASASFAFLYHIMNIIVMVLMGLWGIASTGVTFRNVLDSARSFATRRHTESAP